ACFGASVPNYATCQWEPAPPLARVPHLYYVDAVEGIDSFGNPLEPEFIVDVSATFELKLQMLACHASQRNWLLRQHGIDEYLDSQAAWSRRRGSEIGVEYAEAFRQYLGHAYPHDNLLLALVGQDGRGRRVATPESRTGGESGPASGS